MNKHFYTIFAIIFLSQSPVLLIPQTLASQIELSASLAYDNPLDKPLPDLTDGFGYGFSLGFLPFKTAGLSFGVNSTLHKIEAGRRPGSIIHTNSRRVVIYFQSHYRLFTVKTTEFESYLGVSHNSINGGDSTGSYLELPIDPEEIGYHGWGWEVGFGLKHPIQSGYFVIFNIKYNFIRYSTRQFLEWKYNSNIKGKSLMFNLGVLYRVEISKLL